MTFTEKGINISMSYFQNGVEDPFDRKPLADVFLYTTKDISILIEFAVTLCSVAEKN